MIRLLLMAKKGTISSFIISPLMFITFLVLKLTSVVAWSWWFVCSPLLGIPCGFIGLGIVKGLLKFYDYHVDE